MSGTGEGAGLYGPVGAGSCVRQPIRAQIRWWFEQPMRSRLHLRVCVAGMVVMSLAVVVY